MCRGSSVVEQLVVDQLVVGSIPTLGTRFFELELFNLLSLQSWKRLVSRNGQLKW